MTTEEFNKKRGEMSNEELIRLAEKEISQLTESYGDFFHMTIPPKITDTDMILSEVIMRFKKMIENRHIEIISENDPDCQLCNGRGFYSFGNTFGTLVTTHKCNCSKK